MKDLRAGQLRIWHQAAGSYISETMKEGRLFLLLGRPDCVGPLREAWTYLDLERGVEGWAYPDTVAKCSHPVGDR